MNPFTAGLNGDRSAHTAGGSVRSMLEKPCELKIAVKRTVVLCPDEATH